jgi:hypothetical protein
MQQGKLAEQLRAVHASYDARIAQIRATRTLNGARIVRCLEKRRKRVVNLLVFGKEVELVFMSDLEMPVEVSE